MCGSAQNRLTRRHKLTCNYMSQAIIGERYPFMRVQITAAHPRRGPLTEAKVASRFNQNGWRWLTGLGLIASLWGAIPALAATAPTLGAAQSYAVFGATTVTSTGASAITGDVGVSPGTSVTGFPPGTLSGTIHINDGSAIAAKGLIATAYGGLSQVCNTNLTGQDLGGMTLTPGVYCFDSSAQLTGALTLNALGDPNAVFVFQTGSTLTTATNASVNVINSGQNCNVFWQIGSSATLGINTVFKGNVLASASITLTTGTSLNGRALALAGAVTLDTNAVAIATCAAPVVLPTVTLTNVSNGGVGTFGFSGNNGFASQSITTLTAGVGVAAPVQTLSAAGASTTLTESAPPVGYTLTSVSCSGLGAGGTATPSLVTRSVTLDAAATAAGAAIACTFTNTVNSPVLVSSPIPTLSEWAMITLATLMALFGMVQLRRRGGNGL